MKYLVALLLLLLPFGARAQDTPPLRADLAYTLAIFDKTAAALKDNAGKMNPKELESILIVLPPQKRSGQPIGLTVGDITVVLHVDIDKIIAGEPQARKIVPDPAPFRLTLYRRQTAGAAPADELVGLVADIPKDVCDRATTVLSINTSLPMPAPREGPVAPDAKVYAAAGPTPAGAFNCALDADGKYYLLKFLTARHQADTGAWSW